MGGTCAMGSNANGMVIVRVGTVMRKLKNAEK